MPGITGGGDHCGKPNCDREAEETYEGSNGNSVRVCGMHYYKLVTRGTSESSPLGLGTDISPPLSGHEFDAPYEDGEPITPPESGTTYLTVSDIESLRE